VLLTLHEMTSLDQLNGLHYRTLDAGILRKSDLPAPSGILIEEWVSGAPGGGDGE